MALKCCVYLGEFCDGLRVHCGHLHVALPWSDALQDSTGAQDQLEGPTTVTHWTEEARLSTAPPPQAPPPPPRPYTHVLGRLGVGHTGERDVTHGHDLGGGAAEPGALLDEQVTL